MSTNEHRRRLTINEWLAETGVSLKELADRSGLDLSTIYEVTQGRRWPSYDTLQALLMATGGAVQLWDAALFLTNRRAQPPSRLNRVRVHRERRSVGT